MLEGSRQVSPCNRLSSQFALEGDLSTSLWSTDCLESVHVYDCTQSCFWRNMWKTVSGNKTRNDHSKWIGNQVRLGTINASGTVDISKPDLSLLPLCESIIYRTLRRRIDYEYYANFCSCQLCLVTQAKFLQKHGLKGIMRWSSKCQKSFTNDNVQTSQTRIVDGVFLK